MGQTSIPCTTETRDSLAEQKPERMTWNEFLTRLVDGGEPAGYPELEGLGTRIESIRQSVEVTEQRTGRIERQVERLEGGR